VLGTLPRRQPPAALKTTFEPLHPSVVPFVVVPQQVQQPVQRQPAPLLLFGQTGGPRLARCPAGGDHDVSEKSVRAWTAGRRDGVDREREHISDRIDRTEPTIEISHLAVADQRHGDDADRGMWRDTAEPRRQRPGRLVPASSVGHRHSKPYGRSMGPGGVGVGVVGSHPVSGPV